jgi:hypothetical protein
MAVVLICVICFLLCRLMRIAAERRIIETPIMNSAFSTASMSSSGRNTTYNPVFQAENHTLSTIIPGEITPRRVAEIIFTMCCFPERMMHCKKITDSSVWEILP